MEREKPPLSPPCAFDKLIARNVPHILEDIFFSLDYESFKTCAKVSRAWAELLESDTFRSKEESLFKKYKGKLFASASINNVDEVRRLLSKKLADVNGLGDDKITPLQIAALNGNEEVVKLLLDSGAKPNRTKICSSTPLHLAAIQGRSNVVKILLDRGADPNMANGEGRTPLHDTINIVLNITVPKFIDIIKMLLDAGADPCRADKDGITPLYLSYIARSADLKQILCRPQIPAEGSTYSFDSHSSYAIKLV